MSLNHDDHDDREREGSEEDLAQAALNVEIDGFSTEIKKLSETVRY